MVAPSAMAEPRTAAWLYLMTFRSSGGRRSTALPTDRLIRLAARKRLRYTGRRP
ncbi:hypothetical protein [Mesorhizobium sp. WSM3873]|uniref:hypothetical protein n=1 Tax=Mesorhizobium sp. WSM3873 TaxID=1854056 RepID=UPI0012EA2173|nr:hypothetical protein [Mesorhizobium sp. WSM3873]